MKGFIAADQVIPKITDPLGSVWKQPKLSEILINDTQAILSKRALEELLDYSRSVPTGVYDGKMWKRAGRKPGTWILCWYGPGDAPDVCRIHTREIV